MANYAISTHTKRTFLFADVNTCTHRLAHHVVGYWRKHTLVSGRQVERTAEGNMHKVLHFMTDMSVHDGSRWNKHTNTYD